MFGTENPERPEGRMQAEQRAKIKEQHFERMEDLWQPFMVHGEGGDVRRKLEIRAEDAYVVVEDIEDGRVVFEMSRWPHVDRDGRLSFEGDPDELFYDMGTAQETINEFREAGDVTAPRRSLRIGDVFAVRGLPEGAKALSEAESIWDISLAARNAAKAALFGAAASTVEPEYAAEMAISGGVEDVPPEPGEYEVLQQAVTSKTDTIRPPRGREEQV